MVYFIHHPTSFYRNTLLQQAYKCITRENISSATTTLRQRHHHRLSATLPDDPQDSGTQDELIQMLRQEIGKKQVEEKIEEEVEQGSERLRQVAEEVGVFQKNRIADQLSFSLSLSLSLSLYPSQYLIYSNNIPS
jgi:hypothetical protein